MILANRNNPLSLGLKSFSMKTNKQKNQIIYSLSKCTLIFQKEIHPILRKFFNIEDITRENFFCVESGPNKAKGTYRRTGNATLRNH